MTLKHACAGCAQTSQCVFALLLVHGIVQFTMCVTFRWTFHRDPNQHINRNMHLCSAHSKAAYNFANNVVSGKQDVCSLWIAAIPVGVPWALQCIPSAIMMASTIHVVLEWSCHNIDRIHSRYMREVHTRMILPQVHLRKPCYDFSFL